MLAKTKKKKTTKKWQWAEGSRFKGSATAVGKMIDRLAEQGPVTPKQFVEAARDETSPAHDLFIWDDSKAAQLFREEQARCIIRSCRVIYTGGGEQIVRVGYINVQSDDSKGYLPASQVMTNADFRQQALKNAVGMLVGVKGRIQHLCELSPVVEAIDAVVEKYS